LIIDSIGLLSKLYYYASICYVGGGFGKGIHNILEAAVYGNPVIFGKSYKKFAEAIELIDYGGAQSIKNSKEFVEAINKLTTNDILYNDFCSKSYKYVQNNTGATLKIINYLHKKNIINNNSQ